MTWSSFWLLVGIVSWQLSKVSGSIAMAPNIADIYVIAEPVSKKRGLPVHPWVANFTTSWELNASSPTQGESIVMNLLKAMINSVLSRRMFLHFDNVLLTILLKN